MMESIYDEEKKIKRAMKLHEMIKQQVDKGMDQRLFYRILAMKLLIYGFHFPDVAHLLQTTDQTVRKWAKSFGEYGIGGLQEKERPGRPPISKSTTIIKEPTTVKPKSVPVQEDEPDPEPDPVDDDFWGNDEPKDSASDLERATKLNQSVSDEYEESLEDEFKEKQKKPDDEDDLAW